jgi:Asp-tRNA(Asn)/Glu-tRNA(Gln) amidotransferase A subunit family amidase
MGYATVDDEVAAAVDAAVRLLADTGTEVVDADGVFPEDPIMDWLFIWTASRAAAQGHLRGTPDWELIDAELRPQIELGLSLTAVQYSDALAACHDINLSLERAIADADVLICPTLAGQAPVLGHPGTVNGEESPTWVSFTPFINMSRNPAASVPVGLTADGLPIGLQIIGHQRDDVTVLAVAAALEDLVGFDHFAPVG